MVKFDEIQWNDGLGLCDLDVWAVGPCKALIEEVGYAIQDAHFEDDRNRIDVVNGKINLALILLDQISTILDNFGGELNRLNS